MASHHLEPSVKACHQGYLEVTLKPVPTVPVGDAATINMAWEAANTILDPQTVPNPLRDPGIAPDDRQEARQSLRGLGA